MSEPVQVAIKIRPPLEEEKCKNLETQWISRACSISRLTDPKSLKRKRSGVDEFSFENIFGCEKTNKDVFDRVVKNTVAKASIGYHGTIVLYGQRSSGKTYTMEGTPMDPGIITLTVQKLFQAVEELEALKFTFKASYFEIYNNVIYDLIDSNNVNLELIKLNRNYEVSGCQEKLFNSPDELFNILSNSQSSRKIYTSTNGNKGHTFLSIKIKSTNVVSNGVFFSQLLLADLAGFSSIHYKQSKTDFYINQSFLKLNVMAAQFCKVSNIKKNMYFEDDKLSKLLSTSFGGNTITVFICTISLFAEETHRTLWFAEMISNISNSLSINEVFLYKLYIVRRFREFVTLLARLITTLCSTLTNISYEFIYNFSNLDKHILILMNKLIADIMESQSKSSDFNLEHYKLSLENLLTDWSKLFKKFDFSIIQNREFNYVLSVLQSMEHTLDELESIFN